MTGVIHIAGFSIKKGQAWICKDPKKVWPTSSFSKKQQQRYAAFAIVDCMKVQEDLLLTVVLADGTLNRLRWGPVFFLSNYRRVC